jgi:hypothetical protein
MDNSWSRRTSQNAGQIKKQKNQKTKNQKFFKKTIGFYQPCAWAEAATGFSNVDNSVTATAIAVRLSEVIVLVNLYRSPTLGPPH